jgi:hypothetical protein
MVDEEATTHEKWFRVEVYFCAFSGLFSPLLELFSAPMVWFLASMLLTSRSS